MLSELFLSSKDSKKALSDKLDGAIISAIN